MKYSNHTYYPTALSKVLILLAMFVALPVHAAQKIFQSSTESTVFLSYKTLAEANSGSTIDNRGALDENGYFTYTATSNRDLKTSSSYEISLTDYSGKAYTTLGAYDWKNPHAIGFKIAPYKKYIIRAYFVASKDRGLCIRKGNTYSSSADAVASTTSDGKSSYYTLNYENATGSATETFWVSGIDGTTVYLCAIEVVILQDDFYFENSPVSADLLTAGRGLSPSKNNYNFHNVDVLSDKSMTWTFPVMGSHIGIDSNEDISYNFTSGQTITNCVKMSANANISNIITTETSGDSDAIAALTDSYIKFYWPFSGEADVFVFCRLADDATDADFKAISFQHRDGTGSQTYWIGKSNADPVVFHISKSGDHYLYVSNTTYDFYIYFIGISKSAHFGSGIKDESGASLAYNDVVTMKVGQEKTFTITTTEETLPYNLGMYNWGSSYSYLTMRNPNTNQFTINAHTETTDDETITLLYYSIGGVTKTDSYISGTGEKIQFPLKLRVLPVPVLNVNGNRKDEIEDATLPSVVSVFATTEGGSLSFTLSDATITYSSQQSLVAADPSSLSFSDAAPTVAIPDANTGLTYYYYIKAEKNSQTSYYCLKAYNTIGTDNGIKPIDRAIEFGGSNTPFTDVTTLYKSPSLVSGNPFMYVYASEDRQVQVRADDKKDIVMARAGQFANDGTPLNGVLEIRVSGAGTLKIKGYNNNGRVTDEIKVVKKAHPQTLP